MRNLFLQLALKPYFAELILAIDLSKTVFWRSVFKFRNNFFPQEFMITKILALKINEQAICRFA